MGLWSKAGQNVVAISPSKVLRCRTVMRRPEAERWSKNTIQALQATPQKWDASGLVFPTGSAVDVEELDTSEPLAIQDVLAPGQAAPGP